MAETLLTIWWLLFITTLGLCVGSFLNVVIYRLPHGISLREPLWSFCPHCRHSIAWYDNLPVLSYFVLAGRCRHCRARISPRYPLIELATALVFVVIFDAFFIAQVRDGFPAAPWGVTSRLCEGWPIYLAHVVLFSGLLAMSVIDLEQYWVDIRFTWFITAFGLAMHALWTPHSSAGWARPGPEVSFVMSAVVVGLLGSAFILLRRRAKEKPEPEPSASEEDVVPEQPAPNISGVGWLMIPVGVALVLLLGVAVRGIGVSQMLSFPIVVGIVLLYLYVLMILGSAPSRSSDHQIMEAIEQERPSARRTAWADFVMLTPPLICGVAAFLLIQQSSGFGQRWQSALSFSPVGDWKPVLGLTTAVAGFVIGGAVGWAVRIVFTVVLGKEAFGSGDIHMMAAGGCVAGPVVVVVGFFLTCILAVIGWVVLLPFKRSRAIPLGPWLSLGLLIVVLFYGPLDRRYVEPFRTVGKMLIEKFSQSP